MNKKLFYILFNFANKTETRKKAVVFLICFTHKLFFVLYIFGALYIIFNFHNYKYVDVLKYIFVPFCTVFLARLIRINLKSKRPFEDMNIKSLIYHNGGNSFPSNHSTSAMVLAIALGYIFPYLYLLLILIAIITGILRIMAGVHYPIDIFGGILIGGIFGYIGFFILF